MKTLAIIFLISSLSAITVQAEQGLQNVGLRGRDSHNAEAQCDYALDALEVHVRSMDLNVPRYGGFLERVLEIKEGFVSRAKVACALYGVIKHVTE